MAHAALREVAALIQEIVPADGALLEAALRLDRRLRVTDAIYVALAARLDCPLLTSDGRLAAADPPCDVLLVPRPAQ